MKPEKNSTTLAGGVAIVVYDDYGLSDFLSWAYQLASGRDESLHVLVLTVDGIRPPWFSVPEHCESSRMIVEFLHGGTPVRQVSRWLQAHNPVLMALRFEPVMTGKRHLFSRELDAVLLQIKCPVALIHLGSNFSPVKGQPPRPLVPFSGDANSRFALKTALQVSPVSELTVVATGPKPADEADRIAQEQEFLLSLGEFAEHPRVAHRLILDDNAIDQVMADVTKYDSIIFGASRGNTFARAMLGDRNAISIGELGQRIIKEVPDQPYVLVREYQGWFGSSFSRLISQSESLLPVVTPVERVEIYKVVRRAARPRIDFFMMIALSAAIASLGLLLNSPAVVIGAMLIAPLMSAIIGMGLAMVQGDLRFLANSVAATLRGGLVAVGVGFLIGLFNFDGVATSEMLGRSGPSLLDLAVATFSGAAAAYALCRKNMSASLPGVAIAVALVPPLASIGLFLALFEWGHAYGAFLLLMTNLAAIAFSSGIVFTMVGFRPPRDGSENPVRQLAFRRSFLIAGLLILGLTTNLAIRSIDDYLNESFDDSLRSTVSAYFANDIVREVHLLNLEIKESAEGIVDVVVIAASTQAIDNTDAAGLADRIAQESQLPVRVSIITAPLVSELSSPKVD